jgi:hypothetical protein
MRPYYAPSAIFVALFLTAVALADDAERLTPEHVAKVGAPLLSGLNNLADLGPHGRRRQQGRQRGRAGRLRRPARDHAHCGESADWP